jgi:hypothetical protein
MVNILEYHSVPETRCSAEAMRKVSICYRQIVKPGITCNAYIFQALHETTNSLSRFMKWLKFQGISCNDWNFQIILHLLPGQVQETSEMTRESEWSLIIISWKQNHTEWVVKGALKHKKQLVFKKILWAKIWKYQNFIKKIYWNWSNIFAKHTFECHEWWFGSKLRKTK